MKLTVDQERALLESAKEGRPGALAALLAELRLRMNYLLLRRFNHLSEGHAAIFDDAERIFLRWLAEPNSPKIKLQHRISLLAQRVLRQAAKTWTRGRVRERRWLRLWRAEAKEAPRTAEDSSATADLEQALRAIDRLGEPHRSTLRANMAIEAQPGTAETLAARLQLSEAAARKRLSRARLALLTLLNEPPLRR